MRVLYIFEPDCKEKYKFLFEKLKDFYPSGNKFIQFVPTLYKKNFLEEKLIEFYNKKYIFLPEIHTPASFCEKFIIPLVGKNIISDSQAYVVFHSLLKEDRNLLEVFYRDKKEITGLESFSKRLFDTYKLLKNYLPFEKFSEVISKKEIDDFLSKYPSVYDRINSSFILFDRFDTFIETKNLLPESALLKESVHYLDKFKFDCVIIDSFFDFTETEKSFFDKIISVSESVFASFEDYEIGKAEDILNKTLEFYREKKFDFVKIRSPEKRKKNLDIFRFASRDDEIEEICRKIIYEVKINRRKFSDFILCFPNLKKYVPHIQRIFYIYGIPYNLNIKENIINFPEAKILFSLIDMYVRKFSYNSFMNFITSPLLKRVPQNFREILPGYARMANILIGRDYWARITELIQDIREERSYARKIDDEELEIIQKNTEMIFEVLDNVKPENKKGISEWISWIKNILSKLGYFEEINEIKIYVLDRLKEISEVSGFLKKMSLYELRNILWKCFEDKGVSGVLKEKNGVRIIGLFELTGIENEILIFGGMNDGDFPKIVESDLILPDKLRVMLGIPSRKDIIRRDRLNFEKIKNNFDDIIITFPLEEDERVLLPSPFVENIESVKEGFSELKDFLIGDIDIQVDTGKRMAFSFLEGFEEEPDFPAKKFRGKIEKIFPKQEIYVTDIVSFKRCPFRFYLTNIVGCESIEEPAPRIKGMVIGRIFHKVMENLIKELKNVKYNFEMFENIYDMVVKSVLSDFKIPDMFKIYLRHYLKHHESLIKEKEIERKNKGFVPIYIEKSVRKKQNGFVITGRVDRIDYSPDEGIYEIIDYKTGGRPPSLNNPVDALQLYLYIHLSKEFLERNKKYKVLIYTFGEKEDKSFGIKEGEYEALIDEPLRKILEGEFLAVPYRTSECTNCVFKNFCKLWIKGR